MIGVLTRLYRASPLHPRLGRALARLLGRVTRRLPSPQKRVIDGIQWELDLSEVIDASLFFSGSFEPKAEQTIGRHLGPGMTAIDVGANVGYHTLRMARATGPGGQVIAIEPAPRALARLRRNLALNAFANVEVVAAALDEHDLESAELRLQWSFPLSGLGGAEMARVRVARLDTLVHERRLKRVDLVKIDVDGLEARVLRGAVDTLREYHPVLFFEINPSIVDANGDSIDEMLGSLLALGYSLSKENGARLRDPLALARSLPRGVGCNLLGLPPARLDGAVSAVRLVG
jgi:FkbM family methyltransferase